MKDIETHREEMKDYCERLQDEICAKLELTDGKGRFVEDRWKHREGGGGVTRVLQNGLVFEKAGVNISAVEGRLSPRLAARLGVNVSRFFASGISLVLHPLSPMIPTVHANLRFLDLGRKDFWFGGGTDLTPYYLFEEDARTFHTALKHVCDRHDLRYYRRFKKQCDEYFFIKHRGEERGVGGIFFDNLRGNFSTLFAFVRDCGNSFLDAYLPIVERRRSQQWSEAHRTWQLLRRGRYVEFNLMYDRGTLFGLETGGRIESILMSLPPLVRWEYNAQFQPGSRESELLEVLRNPREWTAGPSVRKLTGGRKSSR